MKIQTVNVIEFNGHCRATDILSMASFLKETGQKAKKDFQTTSDSIHEAEALFERLAKKHGMKSEDAQDCLDNGYFEAANYTVILTHST